MDEDIQDLFVNVFGGDPISIYQLERVAEVAASGALRARIQAVGILAKAGEKRDKSSAWSKLREIVERQKADLDQDMRFDLTSIFTGCVYDEHVSSAPFRGLVYEMAKDPGPHIRCNSMIILRYFAEHGDARATELLKQALNDSDENVKRNAKTFLEILNQQ